MKIAYKIYWDWEIEIGEFDKMPKMIKNHRVSGMWAKPYTEDMQPLIDKHNKAVEELEKAESNVRDIQIKIFN